MLIFTLKKEIYNYSPRICKLILTLDKNHMIPISLRKCGYYVENIALLAYLSNTFLYFSNNSSKITNFKHFRALQFLQFLMELGFFIFPNCKS